MRQNHSHYYENPADFTRDLGVPYGGEGWYRTGDDYALVTIEAGGSICAAVFDHDPRPEMIRVISLPNRVDMPLYPV